LVSVDTYKMVTAETARRTFQIVVAATKQWGIGKGLCPTTVKQFPVDPLNNRRLTPLFPSSFSPISQMESYHGTSQVT